MILRNAHLFSQLLREHLPRLEFESLVRKHNAERHARGFRCWTQLVAMLFCHLGRADSLRVICSGLTCCLGKLVHLGIDRAPNKSTLSYVNAHRPAALFEDLFWTVLRRMRSRGDLHRRKRTFRFKNKLLSLDSTTVSLCLSLFPWASFRRAKGGVKVHVLLDHDDYLPAYVLVSEARRHDRFAANALHLRKGSIVAFDRAYNDYALFARWCEAGIYFVTRMKDNAAYKVVERRETKGNILSDLVVRLSGVGAWEKCPHLLRRIVVWDAENEREIVLLTNHMEFAASTISAIYKDRWEIELFFKALKQNLKIKTFVGTSENALRIQIWTALLAMLLLRRLHHLSRAAWSFAGMAAMLRLNLFTYRDLAEWLHKPYGDPPAPPDPYAGLQLELPFPGFGQPVKT